MVHKLDLKIVKMLEEQESQLL